MSDIDAVCFDLDSTLCVSNQSDREIHQELFERAGIDPIFTPAEIRAVDSTDVETADTDAEFYTNLYRAAVANSSTDPNHDPAVFIELGEITTEIVDEADVSFREGAKAALEYASGHYEVGLITNGGEQTQRAKLETLGISDVFDITVFCDPSRGVDPKPAQEPFQRVISELSASPETVIHIGNDHSSDVVGAHEAGFQSMWVPLNRSHETVPDDPDPAPTYQLESVAELSTIL